MSKTNTGENYVLLWLLNATDSLAGVVTLHCSLHSSSPGEGGDQTTGEITYTGYARITASRSGSGFTIAGSNGSNAADLSWGKKTAGGDVTATYVGIGKDLAGVGVLLAYALITNPAAGLLISNGVIPKILLGDLDWNED